MSAHDSRSGQRNCDVAVIGGSAAGLAAALQLVRQRRSVIVIDAGEPRNAPAAHMHSYLGHEGLPPGELADLGRAEVRSYGGEVLVARAVDVTRTDDGSFRVDLDSGHAVIARRVIAATGLVDELPDIEGLAEHWGGDVIHCPFCHGYEVRDRRIVQIVTHPVGLHPTVLFRQLTDRLTVVLHDGVDADHPELDRLRAAGVDVVAAPARRILSDGDGHVVAVELLDGQRLDADAVVVNPRFHVPVDAFASLGLEATPHPVGTGNHIETDQLGQTVVPGLYAAGNVTDPSQQVLQAAAAGSRVGGMVSFDLADEDLALAARPSPALVDWDHRYSGEQMWSGNPNGSLVAEVEGLSAGRALDVGAGEGGDAVWLATHGWTVTASDISGRAVERIGAQAAATRLAIDCIVADANAPEAFERDGFDLVSAQYVPIPRTPDGRGIANLLAAVAPGGTLLVVNHDLARAHHSHGATGQGSMWDADAMVQVDDVVEVLATSPNWKVEVHETRPRPAGHASEHVHDIVLRARRLEE